MRSTRRKWWWARLRCGWRARMSGGAGTRSWTSTTIWGSGSSRAGRCATLRCGAGTGWRCWAGSRARSSARRANRWLGWHRSVQFRRLHLIGNNTRFLILPQARGIANLASRVLGRSLRRVSADWEAAYGHRLELAETFVDPARFHGGAYDASNWVRVGRTKGFARHNGAYTDAHAVPKEMFVRPLRVDARKRLADPPPVPFPSCHQSHPPNPCRNPAPTSSVKSPCMSAGDSRPGTVDVVPSLCERPLPLLVVQRVSYYKGFHSALSLLRFSIAQVARGPHGRGRRDCRTRRTTRRLSGAGTLLGAASPPLDDTRENAPNAAHFMLLQTPAV